VVLERVTNISMGTEIDNVVEFEEIAERPEDAPPPSASGDGPGHDRAGRPSGSVPIGGAGMVAETMNAREQTI